MGRPPVQAKFKRDKQLNVMLTAEERERVDRLMAAGDFASPSDVVRAALLLLEAELKAKQSGGQG
jgi:Arc/MetJ-type ribon-helix-helix transcriptional regulator